MIYNIFPNILRMYNPRNNSKGCGLYEIKILIATYTYWTMKSDVWRKILDYQMFEKRFNLYLLELN